MRHKRQSLKRRLTELKLNETHEQVEIQQRLKKFNISEERNNRLKIKAEREEFKRMKRELRIEFKENKKGAQKELSGLTRAEKARLKDARRAEINERRKLLRHNAANRLRNF